MVRSSNWKLIAQATFCARSKILHIVCAVTVGSLLSFQSNVNLLAQVAHSNEIAEESSTQTESKEQVEQAQQMKAIVKAAFAETRDGFSSDEVILDDALFAAFTEACQTAAPETDIVEFGWTLINMRKACLLYTSPSPRDRTRSRMPSSA